MSENIKHIFKSAEKKVQLSTSEIREYVQRHIIPQAQESTRISLEKLVDNPVQYLRNLREELIFDTEESGEEVNLIDIVIQDLKDASDFFDRYNINISGEFPLSKYFIQGLHNNEGEVALFSVLKEAGFTYNQVAQLFKDKAEDSSAHKMENAVSLNRLASVYQ